MSIEKAILLVDDEAIIIFALRQELRAEIGPNYRYEIALSAAEGLAVIDELSAEGVRVILVVSDWQMPGMKGDEFLTKVRSMHPEVKTIMVSGQIDEDRLKKLNSSGVLDLFMSKPWDSSRLAEECRRLLAETPAS